MGAIKHMAEANDQPKEAPTQVLSYSTRTTPAHSQPIKIWNEVQSYIDPFF